MSPILGIAALFGDLAVHQPCLLQKLQNRAARIVTNSPYDTSALPLIKSLGWLTIRELIDFETGKIVYKSLSALALDYLGNIFQMVSEATNRQLRTSKTDLRLPLQKTSTGQKSFAYRGAKVWSDLDSVVKAFIRSALFEENIEPNYDSSQFPFLFCQRLLYIGLYYIF